ncbi:hypothetical protein GCM10022222_59120 [Amycolatopsis ultiminotia]|uniref:DUF1275 domain-containing protein n=1 Tax=Amycolatopsis ultiminotia TaxID=543629 RepID=A0ABP6XHN3_9PSEU
MNEPAHGPVPMVGTGMLMVASTVQASPVVLLAAAVALLLVLAAARRPGSWIVVLAALAAAVATAVGGPSLAQGCASGLLTLVFLGTAEARRTLHRHTGPLTWLRNRSRLLFGGLGGVVAVLVGGLWDIGSAWLSTAGVLALGAAYLLAVHPLTRPGETAPPNPRRTP